MKIILANTQRMQVKEEQILPYIAPCYAAKYRSSKRRQDAGQELTAGYLLQKYLGVNRDEQLTYNNCNKPLLASGDAFFNLSHSGDMVALAISDRAVGVDIEKIMKVHEAIVKKVYSDKQKAELMSLRGAARDEKFTEIWTAYEAALKLKGTGFEDSWNKIREPVVCDLHTVRINDYFLSWAVEN